jgi:hypothetical protein
VYVGDEGVTEPSGRTRRVGADVELRQRVLAWLWADADVSVARGRAVGSRPADEAHAVTARGAVVWEAFAGWALGRVRLVAAVDNLFDAAWNEAQFAPTSRLRAEHAPTTELHFRPGARRTLQIGIEYGAVGARR